MRRSEIIESIEKSSKKLQAFHDGIDTKFNDQAWRNKRCIAALIKSQNEIIDALNTKKNCMLLFDDTDYILEQHINRSLDFANDLMDLMQQTPVNSYRGGIIRFDIEQLTYANYILSTAIQAPGEIGIKEYQSHPQYPCYYDRERIVENRANYTKGLENNIRNQLEHLPWREDLKLHLKKNMALASVIAISVAVIVLAATLPPLAPLAALLITLASITILFTILYKAHKDVYPLTKERYQEELSKDKLYHTHLNLFKHKLEALGITNIRQREEANDPHASRVKQTYFVK